MYLAFDPGETTGWALFNDDGSIADWGQVREENLLGALQGWEELPLKAVICEGFIIFRHKARKFAGNRMITIQAIGMIKSFAHRVGATYVEQDSDILPMAQMKTQVKMPGNHAESHKVSAFNHGAWYLINKGIRKSALEEENGR